MDVRTVPREEGRLARARTIQAWPAGWYQQLMGSRLPRPVAGRNRETAVDVHLLRVDRVGQAPTRTCDRFGDKRCPAALCPVCRAEPDTPEHLLLRCPALMTRLRQLGTIASSLEDVRGDNIVAVLGSAHRSFQSRTTTPERPPADNNNRTPLSRWTASTRPAAHRALEDKE